MARINVEEMIWSDARFRILAKEHGEMKAIGMLVVLWRTGIQFYLEKTVISEEIFTSLELSESLIRLGFARRIPGGIEVAGAETHFAWAANLKESHSKAGKASWEARKNSGQDMAELARKRYIEDEPESCERPANALRTDANALRTPANALTLTLPLSLTLSQRERNTVTTEATTSDVEKVADATLSPQRTRRVDDFPNKLESVDQLLELLPRATLLRWTQLYDDKEFLRREVTKAFGFYVQDNPKKCPKNRTGWCRALSSWFERGWTYRAKTMTGHAKVDVEADALMERLKREEQEGKVFGG